MWAAAPESQCRSPAQLHRYGWACSSSRADLITACRFAPEIYVDRLRDGVGHPVPSTFQVGIAAALLLAAIDRLGTALNSA